MNTKVIGFLSLSGGIILMYSAMRGVSPVDVIKAALTSGTMRTLPIKYAIGGVVNQPGTGSVTPQPGTGSNTGVGSGGIIQHPGVGGVR